MRSGCDLWQNAAVGAFEGVEIGIARGQANRSQYDFQFVGRRGGFGQGNTHNLMFRLWALSARNVRSVAPLIRSTYTPTLCQLKGKLGSFFYESAQMLEFIIDRNARSW